jgi:hypothetical protein
VAVSIKWYTSALKSAFNKEIDLDSDTIKVMLCTSSYTPSQGTHQYKSSITNEVTGTGYTAGGTTVASVSVSVSGTTFAFDGGDISWTSATFTARYGILYDSTPATDATRPLLGYIDFGADQSPSAGTLSITWDATGIGAVTVA